MHLNPKGGITIAKMEFPLLTGNSQGRSRMSASVAVDERSIRGFCVAAMSQNL
jgi:hypothetical protein